MIATEALGKTFGDGDHRVEAVRGLDLQVREGEVFGFLGPNGAGKTTTVRLLACLISPSGGRAWVNGREVGTDDAAIRAEVGILTEAPGLYERMTARQNLEVFARLYHVGDVAGQVERYLKLLGLWERRSAPAGTLSKGMKQKLAIARALLHEPPVLFLDEPTSALDPEAAKTVRDFIGSLRGQGRTIFLCTHNLDEAERLCDRIGVFRRSLIAVDTPEALRRRIFGRQTVVELVRLDTRHRQAVEALPFVRELEVAERDDGGGEMRVTLDDPPSQNPDLVQALVGAGARVVAVAELRRSLEEVYLSLVGSETGDAP